MMRARGGDEDGLGLIELIVAIVVSGLFLVVIATMFVNAWTAQEQVTGTTRATSAGQLIGSSIERAMRNALYFEVSDGGALLRVRTSLDADLRCQEFRFEEGPGPAYGSFVSARGAVTIPEPSSTASSGITRLGAAPFLVRTDEGSLTYSFQLVAGATPVSISGDVTPRAPQAGGSDGCW